MKPEFTTSWTAEETSRADKGLVKRAAAETTGGRKSMGSGYQPDHDAITAIL